MPLSWMYRHMPLSLHLQLQLQLQLGTGLFAYNSVQLLRVAYS